MSLDIAVAKADIREFLTLLRMKEESDSGTIFNTCTIHCCRTMDLIRMNKLLEELESWANDK